VCQSTVTITRATALAYRRHFRLKQIAHRINEHELGERQVNGSVSFSGTRRRSSPLVRMALTAAKAFGERFGVAVLQIRADLGAATNGIPGGVGHSMWNGAQCEV